MSGPTNKGPNTAALADSSTPSNVPWTLADTRDLGLEHVWQQHLEHLSGLSPSDNAAAMTASNSDWEVECSLFHRPYPNAESSEDWATDAWSNPYKVDSRSDYTWTHGSMSPSMIWISVCTVMVECSTQFQQSSSILW